ncbi:MAG: ATP-binding protein [Sciscionella sp.]
MSDLTGEIRPATSARHILRDALAAWRLPSELVENAELVVSELVANAVEHGNGAITLRVSSTGSQVRVEVDDLSQEPPTMMMHPGPTEEGHRGLLIVAAVSTRWGSDPAPAGKTVWAELGIAGHLGDGDHPRVKSAR